LLSQRITMRFIGICLIVGAAGCAEQPFMPSSEQRALFNDVIRQAEAAGAAGGSPEAARCLADAKADFNYAQRIPRYPDRARQLATKAQEEGAEALRLAQQHRREMAALAREGARVEAAADVADVPTTVASVPTTAPEAAAVAESIPAEPDPKTISATTTATESAAAAAGPTAHADN
jgi:hypothetical protein